MISFFKTNKKLVIYSLIIFTIIPIFGLNFLLSIISNIFILLLLIPLLLLIVAVMSFSYLKTRIKTCKKCGSISLGNDNTCFNCGSDLDDRNINNNSLVNNPSEKTIEVVAEEIK